MGCCSGDMNFMRQTLTHLISPEIENMIGEKEKLIKFSSLKVKLIESKLKINSFEGMLSSPQLRKCLSDLKFDIKVNKSIENHNARLLRFLQNEKKLYNFGIVMLCGLLLGKGKPNEKASILFDIYDPEKKSSVTKETAEIIMDDIIMMAAKKIPMITADDNEESESFYLPFTSVCDYSDAVIKN